MAWVNQNCLAPLPVSTELAFLSPGSNSTSYRQSRSRCPWRRASDARLQVPERRAAHPLPLQGRRVSRDHQPAVGWLSAYPEGGGDSLRDEVAITVPSERGSAFAFETRIVSQKCPLRRPSAVAKNKLDPLTFQIFPLS
jgi:hypothetical protein